MQLASQFKTVSEQLFSEYLDLSSLEWEYELTIPPNSKKPDFRIQLTEGELLCDVKERSPTETPVGAVCVDPIEGIRKLIEKGRTKFKDFKDSLCALALYNNGDHETDLDPWCIFSAILGAPGFQMPFDPRSGTLDSSKAENVFLPYGGKMIRRYKPLEIHESTQNLSALIAIETFRVRNPVFNQTLLEIKQRHESETGQPLSSEQQFSVACDLIWYGMPMTVADATRVIVCVNPFAKHDFPKDVFCGPNDERWEIVEGRLTRTFCGKDWKTQEEIEATE